MPVSEIATWIVLVAGAATGVGYLFRKARGGFRTVDQLEQLVGMTEQIKRLVDRELNHNHGSSIKDDTYGTAISAHYAHQRIDELHVVLHTFAEANALVLPLIDTAIRATPPPEE